MEPVQSNEAKLSCIKYDNGTSFKVGWTRYSAYCNYERLCFYLPMQYVHVVSNIMLYPVMTFFLWFGIDFGFSQKLIDIHLQIQKWLETMRSLHLRKRSLQIQLCESLGHVNPTLIYQFTSNFLRLRKYNLVWVCVSRLLKIKEISKKQYSTR